MTTNNPTFNSRNSGEQTAKKKLNWLFRFIFKQRCIPWFIILKWRVVVMKGRTVAAASKPWVDFICVQRFVKIIDLEKTYESCFDADDAFEDKDIIESRTNKYPSILIKNAFYVQFLEEFKDKTNVTDNEIKKSRYYKEALKDIQTSGAFQGKKDEISLMQYCRSFLDLYKVLKKEANIPNYLKFINAAIDHYKYGYPRVFKILNSDYHMIRDGHHRLSCKYILGEKFVKVRITGIMKKPSGSI